MFSNLRIGTRLLILVAIQCFFMVAVGLTGLSGVAQSNGRLHGVYEESIVPLLHLDSILNQNFQIRAQLDEALATDAATEAEKRLDRIKGFEAEAEKSWKDYSATPMSPAERRLADAVAQAQQNMIAARQQVVAALRMHGRAAAAEVDKRAERVAKFDRWREAVDKLVEHQGRDAQSDYQAGDENYVSTRWAVMAGMLAGVGVAGFVAWLVIRSISRPLRAATQAAERIAKGDLAGAVEVRGSDEAAALMDAIARMQSGLRDMVVRINSGVSQLSTAAGGLSTSADQVARASQTQSESAAAVASSVEQVTVSIVQLSERAGETQQISSEANRASREGFAIVHQSAAEITSIAQSVDRAAGVVKALGEKSRQIATIVNVIKDIADQTNLLALNAAIEAARAGEQGRGFAVVADEVRKLSEKTAGSTQEIAAMIDSILRGTQDAVSSMEEGVTRVQTGMDLARQAGTSMSELQESSAHMLQAVSDMSSALKEQSMAANEIARQVERMAQMSEENGVAVKQTAQASQDLETLSGELRQAVCSFRL